MRYLYLLFLSVLLACDPGESIPDFQIDEIQGMRPIYADEDELAIAVESPRPINRAGKIYSYGSLLIVGERGSGFHILNNENPADPEALLFVAIPGNNDVAIKDGIIYADNFSDLLALRVTADTVEVLRRLENLIGSSFNYPPQHNVYFECVDPSKGLVVGWETVILSKPQCYRQ